MGVWEVDTLNVQADTNAEVLLIKVPMSRSFIFDDHRMLIHQTQVLTRSSR
ncbi:hypothetical protein AO382_0444 [Moraxella catarrhalis]|uniref:Uncharacterized protein n=1 Tax=Moraxella catarrhalis TaxID=480 RepID=A0A7Z0V0A1_MORCA|nr:hypothetical protein AO382_0444 [Moraxella catarrhalis]